MNAFTLPRPRLCYVCGAEATTCGTFVPSDAMRLTLGVPPDAVMVYGLCDAHSGPTFADEVARTLLASLPTQVRA